MIFLTGAARYLFTPLALAVVLAMMASYLLSRTLVPTMVRYLLAAEAGSARHRHGDIRYRTPFKCCLSTCARAIAAFWLRPSRHRKTVALGFVSPGLRGCLALTPMLGEDFFPQVDAGQIRLHVRAPAGTRIEETEQ